MKQLRRIAMLGSAVALGVVCFGGGQVASAATAVGTSINLFTPESWGTPTIAQRRHYETGGAAYAGFPHAGVLTSISVRTRGDASDLTVSVLRRVSDPSPTQTSFLNVSAVTIPVIADPSSAGHVTTIQTRISTAAGDRFGLRSSDPDTRFMNFFTDPSEFDFCYYAVNPHPVGQELTFESTNCNNYIPLVEGVLEPDADGDGYGDETQDLCPTSSATQGACPPGPAPAVLGLKSVRSNAKRAGKATRRFIITNTGGVAATLIPFSVRSSKSVRKLRIISGCKPGKDKRRCTIASLAPGASVTVKVSLRLKKSTSTTLTARSGKLSAKSAVKFKAAKKRR